MVDSTSQDESGIDKDEQMEAEGEPKTDGKDEGSAAKEDGDQMDQSGRWYTILSC